jgi:rare lipoprotein A
MKYPYLSIIAFIVILMINGCTIKPGQSRYNIKHDHAPQRLPSMHEIKDISPVFVEPSTWANKDYEIEDVTYHVLKNAKGYKRTGIASWYGQKFHGHETSNGEIFDMYRLSAAHKTLPIPSFARVTNLENNKSTIVRVNDRGPFHPDRIIDLSYGAAHKLGVLRHGTANVSVEAIHLKRPAGFVTRVCTIQLAATSNIAKANTQTALEANQLSVPFSIQTQGRIYRMLLGPFSSLTQCEAVLKKVRFNYPKAFIKMK